MAGHGWIPCLIKCGVTTWYHACMHASHLTSLHQQAMQYNFQFPHV